MGAPNQFRLRATAITDIGLVRRQNEDRFLCDEQRGLFAVADGVGGLPGGAKAAQAAVQTLAEFAEESPVRSAADWEPVVSAAHENVLLVGQRINPSAGSASTLTCGTVHDGKLLLAHVGDSRCLLLRGKRLRQLTTDHSAENEYLSDLSSPVPEPRWRQALVRCLGQPDALRPDFSEHTLEAGDIICFTTDGITRVVGPDELVAGLRTASPATARLAQLIDLAYQRGAPDNATAVIVEVLSSPSHA